MTILIKYPRQTSQRNKEFFKRKDNELTNLDWAKWAGWFDTDGSFSSTFDKTKKAGQKAVSMKLRDRYPVELFSKIFESSLCYHEFKTITPEPYRKEYTAQIYKSDFCARKAIWFTKNVYPYLIKEEKKDYAAKLLGYRPESKDFTTWTDDETVHYLGTAIDGDGSVLLQASKRGFKCIRIDICSSDPQYLANIVAIGANKLNLVSNFSKSGYTITKRGIVDKYKLYIYGSRTNLSNFTFFKSLLKYNVMTLDRKKKKIQEFVTCINSKGEKGHTQESRV